MQIKCYVFHDPQSFDLFLITSLCSLGLHCETTDTRQVQVCLFTSRLSLVAYLLRCTHGLMVRLSGPELNPVTFNHGIHIARFLSANAFKQL